MISNLSHSKANLKHALSLSLIFTLIFTTVSMFPLYSQDTSKWAIVIHGGAGSASKNMNDSVKSLYEKHLREALILGVEMLKREEPAIDVVQKVVNYMEDCPLFNAGKGAVMNIEGVHELDAAIMDGSNLKAGAIAGVKDIRNPVNAARLVMDSTSHVFLIGEGASEFAAQMGLEIVENSYFTTEARLRQYKEKQKISKVDHPEYREEKNTGYIKAKITGSVENKDAGNVEIINTGGVEIINAGGVEPEDYEDNKLKNSQNVAGSDPIGTVGCVALDLKGNLAAATSTGGMAGKKWGRVGDVPIIGAGTYANNSTVAVSGTGHGEYWIRRVVAYDISALMEYRSFSLKEAAEEVIFKKIDPMGGSGGGVIAVDKNGEITMTFNTGLMHRAWATWRGDAGVGVLKGEEKAITLK
ncbi:MAG: isoaspartyl peptidase/L-asparaginase [Bacteroidales bacterium]|nr:isoaspartyl peptidase/L-asparaginase [Bacteroidales bacterium]MDD3988686.1 isoaspartyl peptidase/L-asparaginase [Bacteroidales bacterium]MDD4638969.1 isoaspartyl peptidase/L-asparaginase [Bacteroidales bacterium]